uniref:DUF6534 domain-containing protein n=1 Tax=Kwoniella dejecticola CBS 10117 TaxID=1296121 RepID=A0A1A6A915_9TREE|nr:uncharacterized protein I303_02557 [Kwoniella dejecticola CBS 10117]OBR86549.1 hypothetical protein I303_02557 [Kwoniella dejecticola CBS 10117]
MNNYAANFTGIYAAGTDDNKLTNLTEQDAFDELVKAWVMPQRGKFFGPQMFGMMFDLFLFGIMIKQFLIWWTFAKTDRWFVKGVVLWSMVFGFAGSIFNLASCFATFVYGFENFQSAADPNWGSWQPVVAVAGSVGAQAAGAMAADLVITTMIIVSLIKSRTGWENTDQLVNKLLKLCAETQLPPTLITTAILILNIYVNVVPPPEDPVQRAVNATYSIMGCLMTMLPKTFIVGLFATLNARIHLRAIFSEKSDTEPTAQQRKNASYPLRSFENTAGIQMRTEIFVHADRNVQFSPGATSPRSGSRFNQDFGPFASDEDRKIPVSGPGPVSAPIIELEEEPGKSDDEDHAGYPKWDDKGPNAF